MKRVEFMEFHSRRKHHAKALAIKALGVNDILIAVAFASLESIWPIYIHNLFPSISLVGFITAGLSIITLFGFAFLFPVFNKYSAKKVLFASVTANAIGIALFAFIHNQIIFIIIAIINALFIALRQQSFGILLRKNSSLKTINTNENEMYILFNTGYVIGPLLAGFIAEKLSVNAVMVLSSLFLLLSVYSITMYSSALEKKKIQKIKSISPLKNIKHFFMSKRRTISYILTSGTELWWVIPYIFIPIEMIERGLPIYFVGVFLFLLCIPSIIIEEYMEKTKRKDFLVIMAIGYFIVGLCGVAAAIISNIYPVLICVILASFGLGLIEPSAESQFFSVVSQEQATRYYGSFFTAKIVGGFVGRFGVALILLILPFSAGIFIISLAMFSLAIVAIKHTSSEFHKKEVSS